MFILHQQWFYIFRWWQMPLAATFLSGISAFHFRNCRSLDKLWFVPVGPASFKYGRAVEFETLVTLCTLQESSFYSYPLLEFCFLSLSPCFLLPLSCSLVYPCIWLFKNSSALPSRGVKALESEIFSKRWFAWTEVELLQALFLSLVNSQLSSIAFSMDLKTIQTLHSLFRDFGADEILTTRWSDCSVPSLSPCSSPCTGPAGHLAITPKGYSRRQSKVWLQNQWPRSWGSALAQLGRVGGARG